MRSAAMLVVLLLGAGASACAQEPSTVDAAVAALRSGRYEPAVRGLQAIVAREPANAAARGALVTALAEVGRYDEAEAAGRGAPAEAQRGVAVALGRLLLERGRLAAAESAFTRATAGPDSLAALAELGTLRWRQGARAEATRTLERVVDAWVARRGRLSAGELLAVAEASRALGAGHWQRYKDALTAYDAAAAADPRDPEPRVRLGELFLAKYNSGDAQTAFDEALKLNPRHPRALLGAARRRDFDGQPGADSLLQAALAVNPRLVAALVQQAEAHLSNDRPTEAVATAERALAVNPASAEALGVVAAARFLTGREAAVDELEARAREAEPTATTYLTTVAEIVARHRRYREGAELARRAVQRDSAAWHARALLGSNLLRLGDVRGAREELDRAFAGDPFDVWTKNTLDLLDTYKDYDEVDVGRFRVLVEKKESALIAPYLAELGAEAWARFAERYGWQPSGSVRVELYRSHADFSVRTVGLAGLGALGVAFGDVLAMDSPAARTRGQFNWGSTLWHELAHTFTLGASGGRVPRWLSEGLSVYEEWQGRPGWGFDITPDFLLAWRSGKLAPASRLNEGFSRPKFPEQVQYSYVQAALVCEMLAQAHGPQVFRKLLDAYRRDRSTEEAFREATGAPIEALDARFEQWMTQRYGAAMAAIGRDGRGELADRLETGTKLAEQGRPDEAIAHLERAKALFPDYVGPDNPRWVLAGIHLARGDSARAAVELQGIVDRDERHLEAHLMLADLLEKRGDRAGAATALERAQYIWPYDRAQHERLAGLAEATNASARAVRERRAVLAMAPADRAEAQYQLARALHVAGDAAGARREVLKALEIAPSFEKAQELLLTLRGGR
ncbi:MAG TPA: tetratricopeptide repeat protein [Gemmatimonadaceae bacterium]|nr:tetratricopeptide repeat protein [Gemmatimonadaceae bacterium]